MGMTAGREEVAIVTGASRGLGFELALEMAKNQPVIAIARSEEGLHRLKRLSANIDCILADLIDYLPLCTEICRKATPAKYVLHNAGYLRKQPFEKLSLENLQATFDLNLFAPLLLSRQLVPQILPGGHIVNIGSAGGLSGVSKYPGLLAYSSSKSALHTATEIMAAELANIPIYCNALALGSVETEMFKEAFPHKEAACSAPEMAKYIVSFVQNAAPTVNGQVIPVRSTGV